MTDNALRRNLKRLAWVVVLLVMVALVAVYASDIKRWGEAGMELVDKAVATPDPKGVIDSCEQYPPAMGRIKSVDENEITLYSVMVNKIPNQSNEPTKKMYLVNDVWRFKCPERVVVYEVGNEGTTNARFVEKSELATVLITGKEVIVYGGRGEINESAKTGVARCVQVLTAENVCEMVDGIVETINSASIKIKNRAGVSISLPIIDENMRVEIITSEPPQLEGGLPPTIAISGVNVGDSVTVATLMQDGKKIVVGLAVKR